MTTTTNFTNDIKTATSILRAALNVMNKEPTDYLMFELKEAVSDIIENLCCDSFEITIDGETFFAVHDSHQKEFLTTRAEETLRSITDMDSIPDWLQRHFDWNSAAEEIYNEDTFEGIVGCGTTEEVGDYTVYAS